MSTSPTADPGPADRGALARLSLQRTAERLYAEEGLAAVSLRRITEASGHRNKSALQYHFRGRGELVLAIVEEHAAAIARRRAAWTATGTPAGVRGRAAAVVVPIVEHMIELGVPSWVGRFTAQALTDPALQGEALGRLLAPVPHPVPDELRAGADPALLGRVDGMLRALCVDAVAQLETELAARSATAEEADAAWRRLGDDLVTAMAAVVEALLGDPGRT